MSALFGHQTYWVVIVALFCAAVAAGWLMDFLRSRRVIRKNYAMRRADNDYSKKYRSIRRN